MKLSGKEILEQIEKMRVEQLKLVSALVFQMRSPFNLEMKTVFSVSESGESLKILNPDILAYYMQHDRSKVFEAQCWIAERFPNSSVDEKPKKKEKNAKD